MVTYEEWNGLSVRVPRREARLWRQNGRVVVVVILQCGESKVHSGKIKKSRSRAWMDRRMVVGGWNGESMSGWGSGVGKDR